MTNIERYAQIANQARGEVTLLPKPASETLQEYVMREEIAVVRAVIEAFVEDLAKRMCPFCRDGFSTQGFVVGPMHVIEPNNHGKPVIAKCRSVDMRRAAKKILEGE